MWQFNDVLNLITALLIAWSCSLLGVFLVLRKMVMVGDAISHSVLPGIVIAYLVGSQTQSGLIMLGAALFGVLTTIIIDFLYRRLKLQEDASIGLTFTWLFALGVLLISFFANGNVDLDQDCVLFGELGLTFLDKIIINGRFYGTKSMATLLPAFLFILVFIIRGFKGFQLNAFQAEFGQTKGIHAGFWHFALMGMVSVVTVLSFESVGAILVVGFLVVPPANAYLMTSNLKTMHLLSLGIGTFNVVVGYALALQFNIAISPTIITFSGVVFFLTFVSKRTSFTVNRSIESPIKKDIDRL